MNRPKFTCETLQEFNELEGYFNKFPTGLQKQVQHLTFQKKPYKHLIEMKKSHEDRVVVFVPKDPTTLISVPLGFSVEYDNLIFSGKITEKQSVEFHFEYPS